MPSKTEYYEDAQLQKAVNDILGNEEYSELSSIRAQNLKVVPIIKSRTNNDGEHEQNPGPPAKVTKVSDLWRLFTPAHYILVVDYYFFNHASATAVTALLFNALMEVEVEVKDGEVKLASKKPDIQLFAATIRRFGAFDETLLELRDWMNAAKTAAAKSFADKIATGTLDTTLEPEPSPEPEDPPRVQAGPPEDAEQPTRKRGGRKS